MTELSTNRSLTIKSPSHFQRVSSNFARLKKSENPNDFVTFIKLFMRYSSQERAIAVVV